MRRNKSQWLHSLVASAVLAACLIPIPSGYAFSPDGYSGASWGTAGREFNGLEGSFTQGWVRQGVDWIRFKQGQTLQTYAAYNWRFRSKNEMYYDMHGAGLGVALSWGPVDVGCEIGWPRYTELGVDERDSTLFTKWYKAWDMAGLFGKSRFMEGLPFTTWGQVAYDMDAIEGSSTQGWVRQGVDWLTLPGGIVFDTYTLYNWRFRTRNETYYDAHGHSVGLSFTKKDVTVYTEYIWQTFPRLHASTKSFQIYLTWYTNWNLKKQGNIIH